MSSTLDEWEVHINKMLELNAQVTDEVVPEYLMVKTLIELVRAKDEFIQEMIDSLHCDHHWQAKEALALTKELK